MGRYVLANDLRSSTAYDLRSSTAYDLRSSTAYDLRSSTAYDLRLRRVNMLCVDFYVSQCIFKRRVSLARFIDLYLFPYGTLNALRYRDDILNPFVHSYAGAIDYILQADNARTLCSPCEQFI
ncbi:hypothetical protein NPIL_228821 [Nephila pilipes]|uniref:Uncharacterized protein n=1 Tax=Nephila pilipes TaxID=299642 RepID=A0A8X6P4E3_NEPPI|nr:hypothetical protein NPIL_228821 [Nephila pilipes]